MTEELKLNSFFYTPAVDPWYAHATYDLDLINHAKQLMQRFAHYRIFSLGQSPAWLVKTIELLKGTDSHPSCGYIPFSSRFSVALDEAQLHHRGISSLQGFLPARSDQVFTESSDDAFPSVSYHYSLFADSSSHRYRIEAPSPENLCAYWDHLTSIGMDPDTIIQKAANGQPTVILEYTTTGKSLASFLFTIYGWAYCDNKLQQLQNSLFVCNLSCDSCPIPSLTLVDIPITIHLLHHPMQRGLLLALANGIDHGPQSDRLVPSYPASHWLRPPLPMPNLPFTSDLIERLRTLIGQCRRIDHSFSHIYDQSLHHGARYADTPSF